ncbi:MAG TPA: prepilin-type N-terminal cleavage/methylation domain-containing protein [Candidatus Omnitrophota bacterium]|nr:prepilin-type N-terminal cleavage/methylation domain-containing protein [Candidatus Omnitrophota bacterium]
MYNRKQKNAFTIIEIMVVIVILGVLASLAIPRLGTAIELFRSKEGLHVLQSILQAQLSADVDVAEGRIGSYNLAYLDVDIVNLKNFNAPVLDFNGSGSPPNVTINSVNYPVYAHIVRLTNAYTLYIQVDGTILCNTQAICTQMQYAPW